MSVAVLTPPARRPAQRRISTGSAAATAGMDCRSSGVSAPRSVAWSGKRLRLRVRPAIVPGAPVDWWVIARRDPGALVLRSDRWFPGEGWLAYRHDDHELVQIGAFRPKGVPGFFYWKLLRPIHFLVFRSMAHHRTRLARSARRPISD